MAWKNPRAAGNDSKPPGCTACGETARHRSDCPELERKRRLFFWRLGVPLILLWLVSEAMFGDLTFGDVVDFLVTGVIGCTLAAATSRLFRRGVRHPRSGGAPATDAEGVNPAASQDHEQEQHRHQGQEPQ